MKEIEDFAKEKTRGMKELYRSRSCFSNYGEGWFQYLIEIQDKLDELEEEGKKESYNYLYNYVDNFLKANKYPTIYPSDSSLQGEIIQNYSYMNEPSNDLYIPDEDELPDDYEDNICEYNEKYYIDFWDEIEWSHFHMCNIINEYDVIQDVDIQKKSVLIRDDSIHDFIKRYKWINIYDVMPEKDVQRLIELSEKTWFGVCHCVYDHEKSYMTAKYI